MAISEPSEASLSTIPPGFSNISGTIKFNMNNSSYDSISPGFSNIDGKIFSINGTISFNMMNTSKDHEMETSEHHEQEINENKERNANVEATLNFNMLNPNMEISALSCAKRRKLVTNIWEDYEKYKGEGKEWAVCKHCKKLVGSSQSETTHLKSHLESCRIRRIVRGDVNHQALNDWDVARVIIKHGLTSIKSLQSGILDVYQEEKEKLRDCFYKLSCHFSLSFTAVYKYDGYFFVAAYYADDGWELKKNVLGFITHEENYDSLETIKSWLLDWNIDKRICSINCNDYVTGLERWLEERGSLAFSNKPLPTASDLNESLSFGIENSAVKELCKIMQCFAHVREKSNETKFRISVEKVKLIGKKVTAQVVPTTFNFFKLLEAAVGFREAFRELEKVDPGFKSINLKQKEWDKVMAIYERYEVLKPTANVYLLKVCDLYINLFLSEKYGNQDQCSVASSARKNLVDKYWSSCGVILAMAIVFDPRLKMDTVEHWFKEIYGDDAGAHLLKFIDSFNDIYKKYSGSLIKSCTSVEDLESQKLELHRYLEEPKVPLVEQFDIFLWWRVSTPNFPILAKMARDFLVIPVCAKDWDLKNDVDNIVCSYASDDLNLDTIKALVCTKSWLKNTGNK